MVSTRPWAPRFLRIYGTAEVVERDGYVGQGTYLRIAPTISWSWNLAGRPLTDEADGDEFAPRRTVHPPPSRDREAGQQDAALDGFRRERGAGR
jgi:pyridoxamine 5'-phosphate oxidase family protein